jgi:RNA polymerase sigma-70 factor (ECF subfamily)
MELSFEDREIITLQHFRGMSYEEIAELLDIPKGTVMSRLYYARKRLAKLMNEVRP